MLNFIYILSRLKRLICSRNYNGDLHARVTICLYLFISTCCQVQRRSSSRIITLAIINARSLSVHQQILLQLSIIYQYQ